jgi:hypothetical protein
LLGLAATAAGGVSLGIALESQAPDWVDDHPFLLNVLSDVVALGASTLIALLVVDVARDRWRQRHWRVQRRQLVLLAGHDAARIAAWFSHLYGQGPEPNEPELIGPLLRAELNKRLRATTEEINQTLKYTRQHMATSGHAPAGLHGSRFLNATTGETRALLWSRRYVDHLVNTVAPALLSVGPDNPSLAGSVTLLGFHREQWLGSRDALAHAAPDYPSWTGVELLGADPRAVVTDDSALWLKARDDAFMRAMVELQDASMMCRQVNHLVGLLEIELAAAVHEGIEEVFEYSG